VNEEQRTGDHADIDVHLKPEAHAAHAEEGDFFPEIKEGEEKHHREENPAAEVSVAWIERRKKHIRREEASHREKGEQQSRETAADKF
jgi:hypothetical protein